ncbi:CQS_1a_G0057200.mRNA.1.CDS.1 [Saccharomyces cerevisiae]|nr:CQS_1a_G0057200.mRNA.1.CDS.1 [Saccharomyces cerevisiae]CAI7489511.1 CQS_1a_G0057200.mRNA.1.CDS.1 [Saccharomyces cerevisiae]
MITHQNLHKLTAKKRITIHILWLGAMGTVLAADLFRLTQCPETFSERPIDNLVVNTKSYQIKKR